MRAMIYQRPISREQPEGEAQLLRPLEQTSGLRDDGTPYLLTRWLVRFDDGYTVERVVRSDIDEEATE